jgi:hypothetical protein
MCIDFNHWIEKITIGVWSDTGTIYNIKHIFATFAIVSKMAITQYVSDIETGVVDTCGAP